MKKSIFLIIFIISLFLNLYGYSAIEIIPEIVRNAVDIVEKIGEEGFSVFYDKNGGFFYQDQYIFVNSEDGTILVDVAFREIEGTLPADLKDSSGIYILVGNQNTALNYGEGWFSYYWPKPGKTEESRKSVFVKKAEYEGKVYVVGMGYYPEEGEKSPQNSFEELAVPSSFEADQVKGKVNLACKMVEQQGSVFFQEFYNPDSGFLFEDKYIYVHDDLGIILVDGAFPEVDEGKSSMNNKDAKGKYLGLAIQDMGLNRGEGWVSYYWPKPGEKEPSLKYAFIKKAVFEGKIYVIGMGFYP